MEAPGLLLSWALLDVDARLMAGPRLHQRHDLELEVRRVVVRHDLMGNEEIEDGLGPPGQAVRIPPALLREDELDADPGRGKVRQPTTMEAAVFLHRLQEKEPDGLIELGDRRPVRAAPSVERQPGIRHELRQHQLEGAHSRKFRPDISMTCGQHISFTRQKLRSPSRSTRLSMS